MNDDIGGQISVVILDMKLYANNFVNYSSLIKSNI